MSDAIVLTDLVVHRGARRVLHDLSFAVPAGSITGLLGPSGSGKTTAMRAMVGAQVVRSGTVTVLGLPAGSAALRSRVGYVTQAPSVYADLSVRENVRHFAALYGRSAKEADAALADVGLTDAGGQLVRDLSGGQQGRASLACALVGDPEVLVLDEPTEGLDPAAADAVLASALAATPAGHSVLLISHRLSGLADLDEIVVLDAGRVAQRGRHADLVAAPGWYRDQWLLQEAAERGYLALRP